MGDCLQAVAIERIAQETGAPAECEELIATKPEDERGSGHSNASTPNAHPAILVSSQA